VPPAELEHVLGTTAVDDVESLRPRGFASAVGVWRVRAGGDSAVLKLLRLDAAPHPRWPSRQEPDDPYYWRREPLAYESGFLAPFGAPRLRACIARPDGAVALWLDDCGDPPLWTPELLGAAARRLGLAQGALASDLPDAPWLARGWFREYLRLHDVAPDPAVLARLEGSPQTVCHQDLHPNNVLGPGADYVVDWAYCGLGALGSDPGILVADGIADQAFARDVAWDVADAVWDGYVAGLHAAGWAGDLDDVRFAFARGTALRLAWLPPGTRPEWDATIAFLRRLASER
jgi:Phosphotransferase enzyme family